MKDSLELIAARELVTNGWVKCQLGRLRMVCLRAIVIVVLSYFAFPQFA